MQLSHRLSPLQEREDAGNRTENLRLSWERDFAAYLDTVRTTHPDQHSARLELAKAVEHDPQSAGAWWAFLRHEESAAPQTSCATPRGTPRSQSTNLCDLYRWATRLVPRPDNSHRAAFVKLWLGYARQQWYVFFFFYLFIYFKCINATNQLNCIYLLTILQAEKE